MLDDAVKIGSKENHDLGYMTEIGSIIVVDLDKWQIYKVVKDKHGTYCENNQS